MIDEQLEIQVIAILERFGQVAYATGARECWGDELCLDEASERYSDAYEAAFAQLEPLLGEKEAREVLENDLETTRRVLADHAAAGYFSATRNYGGY